MAEAKKQAKTTFSTEERAAMKAAGFDWIANLDDGDMWPTSFALIKIGPEEQKRITALVKKAVS